MTEYRVSQPKEPSLYEQMVDHRMEIEHVPGAYFGREHPDACPDCAANPEMAEKVHAAEAGIAAGMDALKAFFVEGDVDPCLLMNMVLSSSLAMNWKQYGISEEEGIAHWRGQTSAKEER